MAFDGINMINYLSDNLWDDRTIYRDVLCGMLGISREKLDQMRFSKPMPSREWNALRELCIVVRGAKSRGMDRQHLWEMIYAPEGDEDYNPGIELIWYIRNKPGSRECRELSKFLLRDYTL